MNTVKFRGWSYINGRMYSWKELLKDAELLASFFRNEFWATNPPKYFWGRMQYIGLRDCKGRDIYENDIVIFDNSDIGGERHEGVVERNLDLTLDSLAWGLWIPKRGWLRTDFLGHIQIIGNIFEIKGYLD